MAIHGDVRSAEDFDALFVGMPEDADVTVYHLASRITIESRVTSAIREVNVKGTRQVIDASLPDGARRLVYVSAVHAIPEPEAGPNADEVVNVEPDHFDPELVVGGYAKTKSEATQLVLPMWFARTVAPLAEAAHKMVRKPRSSRLTRCTR